LANDAATVVLDWPSVTNDISEYQTDLATAQSDGDLQGCS
jgi:hypothetical protein